MRKTKAAFRALREECGFSQQDIADEAGVSVGAVKKWENAASEVKQPPDDVWRFLLAARGALYEDARELAEAMRGSLNAVGGAEVTLSYYRTQEQLDEVQLKTGVDEPVGYYNARMRAVARLLEQAEVPYTYDYGA